MHHTQKFAMLFIFELLKQKNKYKYETSNFHYFCYKLGLENIYRKAFTKTFI